MALSTIFAGAPKRGFSTSAAAANPTAAGNAPVSLQLDAMISEAPDYAATPTQSQVEDGETISDHVTLKPIKLVVQGIVTDTPVGFRREFSSAFQSPIPSVNALAFLIKLWQERLPFTFVGGLSVYNSMVITAFTPTNTHETGDALKFTCTMEQVRTVSSQTIVTLKKPAQPKQSRGQQVVTSLSSQQKVIADASGDTLDAFSR